MCVCVYVCVFILFLIFFYNFPFEVKFQSVVHYTSKEQRKPKGNRLAPRENFDKHLNNLFI